jgi:hypothetical protein
MDSGGGTRRRIPICLGKTLAQRFSLTCWSPEEIQSRNSKELKEKR